MNYASIDDPDLIGWWGDDGYFYVSDGSDDPPRVFFDRYDANLEYDTFFERVDA